MASTDPGQRPDEYLESVLDRLRQRVREGEASGQYPEGLVEDLDSHYRRLVGQPGGIDEVDRQLAEVDRAADIGRHRIYTDSRVPMGSAIHSTVARITARQTQGVLDQVAQFATAVRDLLHSLVDLMPDQDVGQLSGRVDLILDRLTAYERVGGDAEPALRELAARVEALERVVGLRQELGSWSPAALDAAERRALEPWHADLDRVVRNLPSKGRVLELDAEPAGGGDTVAHLANLRAASLAGVVARRRVESLSPQRLGTLVAAAGRALQPGGHLVLAATPRPGVSAIFVRFLAEQTGFASVELRFAADCEADGEAGVDGFEAPAAALVERLRSRLRAVERATGPYAVIAVR